MEGFALEAAAFLLRWLHVVAAIAWIGESFYFVALDRGLKPGPAGVFGLAGQSWSVHGGGFYLKQKYLPAPAELPAELHWSKWKSYTTWLSGFALLCLSYLWMPQLHLVDPRVLAMDAETAVTGVLVLLVAGWLIYDLLCRLLGAHERVLGAAVSLLVAAIALGLAEIYSGRAAYLLTGAMLGTWMSANVLMVIIPGQKRMVAALQRGQAPDPLDGLRGRQRSVHNTYLTLPVVFAMLSTHYAPAYAHPHNGALLLLFLAAAALIRQFFVLWHSGRRAWGLLVMGTVLLLLAFAWLAPRAASPTNFAATSGDASQAQSDVAVLDPRSQSPATTSAVAEILSRRCAGCHSAAPTLLASAPKGAVLETPAEIERQAQLIHQQTVVLQIMPPGNLTQMSEAERALIGRWYRQLAE